MATYSKEEIAFIQLEASIELYNKKNYIAAITLGGVAEELFSSFLKAYAQENNLKISNRAEIDQGLFEFSRDILGIDNYISYRNRTRNELKHHGEQSNKDYVKGNFKNIALMHISGAVTNYKLRTKRLPKHKIIIEFCVQKGIS